MESNTLMEVRLRDGLQLRIEIEDYNKFIQDVKDVRDLTLIVDVKTGTHIFASEIATFRKVD